MITGIPPYQAPIEQSMRCVCGRRYVVYLGGRVSDALDRAQERADLLRARFVRVLWIITKIIRIASAGAKWIRFLPTASIPTCSTSLKVLNDLIWGSTILLDRVNQTFWLACYILRPIRILREYKLTLLKRLLKSLLN